MARWMAGWMAGRAAYSDIKANSAELKLELGLSLAKNNINGGHYLLPSTPKGSAHTLLEPTIIHGHFLTPR